MPDPVTPPASLESRHVHNKFDNVNGWWDCPACYPKPDQPLESQEGERIERMAEALCWTAEGEHLGTARAAKYGFGPIYRQQARAALAASGIGELQAQRDAAIEERDGLHQKWLIAEHAFDTVSAQVGELQAENERLRRQLTRGMGELEAELTLADCEDYE